MSEKFYQIKWCRIRQKHTMTFFRPPFINNAMPRTEFGDIIRIVGIVDSIVSKLNRY